MPRWLDHLLPRIDIEGEDAVPETPSAAADWQPDAGADAPTDGEFGPHGDDGAPLPAEGTS
jgi:hypothetical protein